MYANYVFLVKHAGSIAEGACGALHLGPLSFEKCPPSLAHFWPTYLNTPLRLFILCLFSTSSWLCKVNIADPDRSTILVRYDRVSGILATRLPQLHVDICHENMRAICICNNKKKNFRTNWHVIIVPMTSRKRKIENIVFCEIERLNVTWGVLEYGVRYVIPVSNNAPIHASLTFY